MTLLKTLGNLFSLSKPLAEGVIGDADDTLNTKKALSLTGDYQSPDDPMTWLPDKKLYQGIESFQARNGLKVDGVMNPGGETEKALGDALAEQLKPPVSASFPSRTQDEAESNSDPQEGWGERFARQMQAARQSGFNITASVNGKPVHRTNPMASGKTAVQQISGAPKVSRKPAVTTAEVDAVVQKTNEALQSKARRYALKHLSNAAIQQLAQNYARVLASGDGKRIEGAQTALNTYSRSDRERILSSVPAYQQQGAELSEGAVRELGSYYAHRVFRAPHEQEDRRLEATENAHQSYTPVDQKRIQQNAAANPHGATPEGHDVWRGSPEEMAQVMGLDQGLVRAAIDDLGQDAADAMSAAASFSVLRDQRRESEALRKIYALRDKGHEELAHTLLQVALDQIPNKRWQKTSLKEGQLDQFQSDQEALKGVSDFVDKLPVPNRAIALGNKIINQGLDQSVQNIKREKTRRKKPH